MFKDVLFYTNKLKQLRRFYANVLELPITESSDDMFTVKIGTSEISFKKSDQPAFYHFAINIPGNQFTLIKHWLKDRLTLNREGGIDQVYFSSFDADSMYFEDPAGNIIEYIGRRNRDVFGNVTNNSFLNISEVSLTTPSVSDVGDSLQDFGIPLRHRTEIDAESLNFLGRDETFIVLVPPKRKWYFSKLESETHPLEITLTDNRHISLNKDGKITLAHSKKQNQRYE